MVKIRLWIIILLVQNKSIWSSKDRCNPSELQCHISKKCIARDKVRNGLKNCGQNDTSDEDKPLSKCHSQSEFRCRGNGQCIPRNWINREAYLCHDGSDKGGISGFPCNKNTEFKCANGRCISRDKVKNGMKDCASDDLSDENSQSVLKCHQATEFRCNISGRCIDRMKVQNSQKDCPNGEDELIELNCTRDEYQCKSKRCIRRERVGNRFHSDCVIYHEDEIHGAINNCFAEKEFECQNYYENSNTVRQCIPRSWVNDGILNCLDGSDENVLFLNCTDDEWSCDNGTRCLIKEQLCDGMLDCMDCSDETNTEHCTDEEVSRFFRCVTSNSQLGDGMRNGSVVTSHCVLRSYFCDGIVDCADGSDEAEIGPGFKCRLTKRNKVNKKSIVNCARTQEALNNYFTNCASIIMNLFILSFFFTCKFSEMQKSRTCILPTYFLHDGVVDCDDSSDEVGEYKQNRDLHVECLSKLNDITENNIKSSQICNGIFDCHDLSDECICDVTRHSINDRDISTVCNNICYDSRPFFNENQKNTTVYPLPCQSCKTGYVLCGFESPHNSTKCIKRDSVCDGVIDCTDKRDEAFCVSKSNATSHFPTKVNNTFICPLSNSLRYARRIYEEIPFSAQPCDGIPECVGLYDECGNESDGEVNTHCSPNKPQYCKYLAGKLRWDRNNVSEIIQPSEICNGLEDWSDGSDELYCNDTRYYCDAISTIHNSSGKRKVSIDKAKVCDGHVDCNDFSDEFNCSEYFYCNDSGVPMFIHRDKVLDGHSDCASGSDECPDAETFADDPLSSRDNLIKSVILRVWLWFIAIMALSGNLIIVITCFEKVITSQLHLQKPWFFEKRLLGEKKAKRRHDILFRASPLSKCNDVLVLNLALADFLTGVYLFTVAVKSSEFSGTYCDHELTWRSSKQCESIGVLVLISTQVSVGIMVALSSYRLIAVINPWRVSQCKIKMVIFWAVFVWSVSICFGLLPTASSLNDVFMTSVLVTMKSGTRKALYFSSKKVSKQTMTIFLRKSCVLSNFSENISQICGDIYNEDVTWKSLFDGLSELFPELEIPGHFGYFSNHGVCLPALYPLHPSDGKTDNEDMPSSIHFTGVVMSLTFLSFLYIAGAYFTVCQRSLRSFRRSSSTTMTRKGENRTSSEKRVQHMHKRIGRLVVTDFFCWVPVCIISFCGISGIAIPGWLYSFIAVVLLPINSVINPILYSDIIKKIASCLMNKLKKHKSNKNSETSSQTVTEVSPSLGQFRSHSVKTEQAVTNTRSLCKALNKQSKSLSTSKQMSNIFLTRKKKRSKKTICSQAECTRLTTLQTSVTTTSVLSTTSQHISTV